MSERPAHDSEEVEIVSAHAGERLEDVRRLLGEYQRWLAADETGVAALGAQGFEHELANLPGDYAPPRGLLLAALLDGTVVGCIALRPLDATTCEVKRLYVDPARRGMSLGHKLIDTLLDQARALGYSCVRLDTLPFMRGAVRLYRAFDFEEIAPYSERHVPGARYFERQLEPR